MEDINLNIYIIFLNIYCFITLIFIQVKSVSLYIKQAN